MKDDNENLLQILQNVGCCNYQPSYISNNKATHAGLIKRESVR